MNKKLRPYMVYSAEAGSENGAELVFAHTVREARKVFWQYMANTLTDEYIDVEATLLRNHDFLYKEADQEKLKNNIPHHVFSPILCKSCEMWGMEIGEDGICDDCREG